MKWIFGGIKNTVLLLLFVLAVILLPVQAVAKEAALTKALAAGGVVILIRHALAPGMGDPDLFRLGDCSTQRNLSAVGRRQAKRIGARLRDLGVTRARIHSSQWCRCLETAKLLGLGKVTPLPALNSFFGRPELEKPQMRALRQWLSRQKLDVPLVLVTHQVNITALSDVFPQ